MKKKILLFTSFLAIGFLAGCIDENSYYYEEQLRNESQIEAIIEAELEAENPEYDLEVNITEDTD